MFLGPWSEMHRLNLGWFIAEWNKFYAEWQSTLQAITGALTGEIERVEAAMTDLYAARDAAAASATAANSSALNASASSLAAMDARDAAVSAKNTAQSAASSATASKTAAGNSATLASNKATQASNSATQAGNSASAAQQSATSAGNSAITAQQSETDAATDALKSEGHAVGKQNGTDVGSSSPYYENNAKYYAEEAAAIAASIPPDYTALANHVTTLADRFDEITEKTPNLITGKILTANMSSAGKIVITGSDTLYYAPIERGKTYCFATDLSNPMYGLYSDIPAVNSVAIDNTRHIGSNTLTASEDGYLCIKTSAAFAYPQIIEGSILKEYTPPDTLTAVDIIAREAAYKTVYVAVSGSDSNDGSKASPFATLQKAITTGADKILVAPGEYAGFLVSNREKPLEIALSDMGTYNASTQPYIEKIKIVSGDSIYGCGIYASDCTRIVLHDVWVDGIAKTCMYFNHVEWVECVSCIVSNNTDSNQMGVQLMTCNGLFRDCIAHDCIVDGFNIHGLGDTTFINCKAYNNGDDGISHHDGCTGYIEGGEYYGNAKAGIASPYGGAIVNINGAYVHDNDQFGLYIGYRDNTLPESRGLVNNCVVKDNGTYDILVQYATVIAWQNIYDTKSVSNATFTEISNG